MLSRPSTPGPGSPQGSAAESSRVVHLLGDELLGRPTPPAAGAPLPTLAAADATERLRRGEELAGLRIEGDLVLGQEDVGFPLEMDLGEGQKVLLAGLAPPPPVERLPFPAALDVRGCLFTGRVVLAGLALAEQAHFHSCRFLGEVDARQSTFDRGLVFFGCAFEGEVSLSDALVWHGAFFNRCRFAAPADFFALLCPQGATFSRARFEASCVLTAARFQAASPLEPCFRFDRVVCLDSAFFERADFDGLADFTASQFQRLAELSDARFREVDLSKTDFRWLEITWEQLAGGKLRCGRVVVPRTGPPPAVLDLADQAALAAAREAPTLAELHRQYDVLRALFRRQGDHVSDDACFYEWKQLERRGSWLTFNPESWVVRLFHTLNWLICGYGVRPLRTLVFAAAVVLLCALATTALAPPPEAAGLGALLARPPLLAASLAANLQTSLLAFMNFELPPAPPAAWVGGLWLVERLVGWLALLLFVATYTRILLR